MTCPLTGVDQARWLARCPSLTDRQIKVGVLLVRGANNDEIARDLSLTTAVAQNDTKALLRLCAVPNRTALANAYWHDNGDAAPVNASGRWTRLSPALTTRHRQVATLLIGGASNIDIARDLCISPGTVKGHTQAITALTGIHGRTALACAYWGGRPYPSATTRRGKAQASRDDTTGDASEVIPPWAWLDGGRAAS